MKPIATAFLAGALFWGLPALAQEAHKLPAGNQTVAPEVQILDSALPENNRMIQPVPQTEVSREQFQDRPNKRVGEIIKNMPGVLLGGAPGEDKEARIKGLDKEYTRVSVDGFQIPDAGEKREFQVNRLSSYQVEEVRILHNPTAEYESDGLAGRVEVVTRSIPDEPEGYIRFGLGGQEDIDGDIKHGVFGFGRKLNEHFGFLAGADILSEPLDIDREKSFTSGKSETENETKDKLYTNVHLDLGYFYTGGEFHLKPFYQEILEDKEKDKLVLEPGKKGKQEPETEDKDQQTVGIMGTHEHDFSSGLRWESRAGYFVTEEVKDKTKRSLEESAAGSGNYALKQTEYEDESKEDRTLDLDTRIALPFTLGLNQEFKTGVSMRLRDRYRDKEKIQANASGVRSDKTTPKDNYELEENYFAAFAQNEIFLSEKLSILPGARVEHVLLDARTGDGESDDSTQTDVNPNLHLRYAPFEELTFLGAVSRSVNRPKFDELSPFIQDKGSTAYLIGNPDLEPATSWNYDIGANYALTDLFLGVNLFHKDIEDVIEEVDTGEDLDGRDVYAVENVGDGWARGIQLEQRVGFGWTSLSALKGLTLWANQSFLDSELTDSTGETRKFKEQPDYILNTGFDYTYEPWGTTFSLVCNHISEREADKYKTIDAQTFLNTAVHQRLYDDVRLFFEADNLTDEEKVETTRDDAGLVTDTKTEGVGRTFMVGLEMTF